MTKSVHVVPVGNQLLGASERLLCGLLILLAGESCWGNVPCLSSLSVLPAEITLDSNHPFHGLLVTGVTVDGFEVDLTTSAQYVSDAPGRVTVDAGGTVRAIGEEGVVRITARFEGHSASVAVVCRLSEPPKVNRTSVAGSGMGLTLRLSWPLTLPELNMNNSST